MTKLNADITVGYICSDKYDVDEALPMIESLKAIDSDVVFIKLAEALIAEEEPIKRNRLAIALKDLGDRRALKILMATIRKANTKGYRGTLIYAMSDFNPIEYIYDLVFIVTDDTMEASGNALDIIESLDGNIDEDEFEKCVVLIQEKLKVATGTKKDDLEYLLEMFEA